MCAKQVVPYTSERSKKEQVEEMFDEISGKYDLLNRMLSFGIDKGWRKQVLKALRPYKPQEILDIATGTADLAIALAALKPQKIIGADISEQMLEIGRSKVQKKNLQQIINLQRADSENLPYKDNTCDAVTVSFGVRNYENLLQGLTEMNRVLKPGGVVAILEFSTPGRQPFKSFYKLYLNSVLPLVGKIISKNNRAYGYLAESVQAFPYGNEFTNIMQNAGFQKTKYKELTFGICTLYLGEK